MKHQIVGVMALCAVAYGVPAGAQTKPKATGPAKTSAATLAKINEALSAGPADIRKGAMVMDWPAKEGGEMTMLRSGANGWMCMPSTPAPTGAIGQDPMCVDKAFGAWAQAFMAHKDPPPVTTVGVAYMLHGDRGASNTDPFASAPTADNQWVVTGAHVMMLVPAAQLEALPTDPKAGGPFVMWKGTKYAHIMVPTAAMPKAAVAAAAK